MPELKGCQRRYLRGLAHRLKPSVFIGKQGLTEMVYMAIEQALISNELVKISFMAFKQKEAKKRLAADIEHNTGCCLVGTVGHTALFYRPHPQPAKRRIILPASSAGDD